MIKLSLSLLTVSILAYFSWSYYPSSAPLPTRDVASQDSGVGKIKSLMGEASVLRQGEVVRLKIQDSVFESEEITTKHKSFVKLEMIDKSTITLGASSSLKLQSYKVASPSEKNIAVELVKGIVRTHFMGKNQKGSIEVRTPSAVMGVRGTDFITELVSGKLEVSLVEGRVEVLTPAGLMLTALLPGQRIVMNNPSRPGEFSLSNFLESSHQMDLRVEDTSTKTDAPLDESASTLGQPASNGLPSTGNLSPLTPSLAPGSNSSSPTTAPSANSKASPLTSAVKQMEAFNAQRSILTAPQFNALASEKKVELLEAVKKVNEERVAALEQEEKVMPLITPDNKVVFFEDKPELKALLPTDEKGNILGLRIDENYELVGELPSGESEGVDLSRVEVPVVNAEGEVEKISVQNSLGKVAEIPVTPQGQSAGITEGLVEQAKREIASIKPEAEDKAEEVAAVVKGQDNSPLNPLIEQDQPEENSSNDFWREVANAIEEGIDKAKNDNSGKNDDNKKAKSDNGKGNDDKDFKNR